MLLSNSVMVFSQTILSGNLYHGNPYLLNPAYAGYRGFLSANINFRQTSADVKGAPMLIGFGMSSPVYKGMSLGARFYKQSEGLFNNISVLVDYSYRLKLNTSQSLSLGLATGLNSNQINFSDIIADDPSAIIDIASRNYKGLFFQSAAGIAYNWKMLDISFSVPQLFDSKRSFNPDYCTYISYNVPLKSYNIGLKPAVFVVYNPGKPVLYDLSLTTFWMEKFYVGFTYRNLPGAIFSAGFNLKDLTLSYAIEIGLQKQSNIFNQVHEISLSYSFKKKRQTPVDTISGPDIPLIVKNDSLKADKISKISQNKNVDSTSISNINDQNVSKDTSYTNVVQNVQDSFNIHHPKDSVISKIEQNDDSNLPDLNDYEIVDVGDGIYSIKLKNQHGDSLLYSKKADNDSLNAATVVDGLLKKIVSEKGNDVESSNINEKGLYSIQLFINESNNYILRDAEIAMDTKYETDKDGKFLYYLGQYKSKEEALTKLSKLKRYNDLIAKIVILDH
jgi:type IX secretion system PorP/SprF family membrane protein